MQRQQVVSSDVRSVGYDPESRTLEIEFHSGGVYEYDGVPQEVHEGLISAPSVGRYFHQYIRNRYDYRRVR